MWRALKSQDLPDLSGLSNEQMEQAGDFEEGGSLCVFMLFFSEIPCYVQWF